MFLFPPGSASLLTNNNHTIEFSGISENSHCDDNYHLLKMCYFLGTVLSILHALILLMLKLLCVMTVNPLFTVKE